MENSNAIEKGKGFLYFVSALGGILQIGSLVWFVLIGLDYLPLTILFYVVFGISGLAAIIKRFLPLPNHKTKFQTVVAVAGLIIFIGSIVEIFESFN